MADGRHFENSFISISQSRIIRFRSNLLHRYKFPFPAWNLTQKIENFQIQDGGWMPYWKSFLAISRHDIGWSTRNLEQRWRITCRYRLRDQNCNFRKYKLADGRQFEKKHYLHISAENYRISIKFGIQLQISIPSMEIWQKNRNFANSRWRTDAILKIFFWLYLSAILAGYANFGVEMKNHMQISVAWPKWQFSQIQDGGRPPFWK